MKKWNKNFFVLLFGFSLSFALPLSSCSTQTNNSTSYAELSEQQVNYLNKNSLSLNFKYIGNYESLNNQINKLVSDSNTSLTNDIFDFRKLASWTQELFGSDSAKLIINNVQFSQSGTGWVFDYSLDSINNLVNYYIATNAHVTNLELKYPLFNTLENSELKDEQRFSIQIGFPINNKNVSKYESYISQPYNDNPIAIYDSQYWFPAQNYNEEQNTILQTLPIGQLDNQNKISVESSKEICFYYEISQFNSNSKNYLFVTMDANNRYKVIPSWRIDKIDQWLNFSPLADDFQIIKLQYNSKIQNNINSLEKNSKLLQIQNNIKQMLNYRNDEIINENSSYISRLNYLIDMEKNNKNYDNKWFLFNDFNNLNSDDLISFGGFPVIKEDDASYAVYKYAYGAKSDIYSPNQYLHRPIIWYQYNGKFIINNYNNSNNWLVQNQQTGPGSSGSMVIANNQWIGIYWGVSYYGNEYYGAFTPIYSSDLQKQTIVTKYLEYIKAIDSNSKLLELFNLINMKK